MRYELHSAPSRRPSSKGPGRGSGMAGALAACTVLIFGCDDADGWRIPARPSTEGPALCIGPKPPASAWEASPSGPSGAGGSGGGSSADGGSSAGPEPGSPPPAWALTDFQPQSCGYEATYGLEMFRGRPTAVSIWSAS